MNRKVLRSLAIFVCLLSTNSSPVIAAPVSPIAPGDIIFTEFFNGWHKLDPATGQITELTEWNSFQSRPRGLIRTLTFDTDGAILFGSTSVTRLNPLTGEVTSVRSFIGRSSPGGFVVEPDGNLLFADGVAGILRFSRSTQTLTTIVPGGPDFSPRGITRTPDGRIFVTDPTADVLEVNVISGTTSPVTDFDLLSAQKIVSRFDGQLLVESTFRPNGLYLIDPDTGDTTLFSNAFFPFEEGNFVFDASGNLWQGGIHPNGIYKYPPSGGTPTLIPAGPFFSPEAFGVVPLGWTPPPVPEPTTLVLLGSATLTGFGLKRSG